MASIAKVLLLLVWSVVLVVNARSIGQIVSPNGQLKVGLTQGSRDKLIIGTIELNGKTIVDNFEVTLRYGSRSFKRSGSVRSFRAMEYNQDYTALWGPRKTVENRFTQAVVNMITPRGIIRRRVGSRVEFVFRVFDDGFAYQTRFPRPLRTSGISESAVYHFVDEENAKVWSAYGWRDIIGPLGLEEWDDVIRVPPILGPDALTPVTIEASSSYLSFHEANLRDARSARPSSRGRGLVQLDFSYSVSGYRRQQYSTAWRTVHVVDNPAKLTTSDLLRNLNEGAGSSRSVKRRSLAEWVRPGLILWDWRTRGAVDPVTNFRFDLNMETIRRHIDFASDAGIPYVLVDDGWYNPRMGAKTGNPLNLKILDVRSLARYAQAKGVGLMLYVDYEVLRKRRDLDRVFKIYHSWGIVGIKHGFASGERSNVPSVYKEMLRVLNLCQKYELHYIIHEQPKPSGWERTYPFILGTEFTDSQFDNPSRPAASPQHLTTLPFVNHLAGPVDRSPGMFDLDKCIVRDKIKRQVPTTIISQIAQVFVYPSGGPTLVDTDYSYQAKPALFNFLLELNSYFDPDQTWADGRIGEWYMVTKQKGEGNFITCGITAQASTLSVDPTVFLPSEYSDVELTWYFDNGADGAISSAGPEIPTTQAEIDAIAKDTTKREWYGIIVENLTKAQLESKPLSIDTGNGGGFCLKYVVNFS